MTDQEHIRHELLVRLYGTRKLPLPGSYFARRVSADANCTAEDVLTELQFLADAGLVSVTEDKLGSTRFYKLTAEGVLHYERNR